MLLFLSNACLPLRENELPRLHKIINIKYVGLLQAQVTKAQV